LTASLAAVYIVTTFFPLTPFIGGPGFITFEIVILPVIAAVLRPPLASSAVLVGSIGMALGQPSFYRVFGLPGLLIPVIAVALGSLGFHYRWGPLFPWTYVTSGAAYYLAFSGGTVIWLIPYAIVILSLPLALKSTTPYRIGLLALYTAMCEQVTINVLSISLLGLVGTVWLGITPFMFSERAVATFGGASIIVALKSRLGTRIGLGDRVQREVK